MNHCLASKRAYINWLWSQQIIGIALNKRFYRRFTRSYGGTVSFRERNRMRASFAILAMTFQMQSNSKSLVVLKGFFKSILYVQRAQASIINFKVRILFIEDLLSSALQRSQTRFLTLKEKIEHERSNLIKQYTKKASIKDEKKMQSALFLISIKKIDLESDKSVEMYKTYMKKNQNDHMIEYAVYKYCEVYKKLLEDTFGTNTSLEI